MSDHQHLNGAWPDLSAVPPPIEAPPENATPMQLARSFATTIFAFGQLWPKIVHALEFLKGAHEHHLRTHGLGPMRDPESSYHDFDQPLDELRADMRAKVKDRHHPISEASALRLMRQEAARVRDMTELGTWRGIKGWLSSRAGKAADRALTVLAAGAVGWLVHYLLSR
jgi:hypothetical protein